MERIWCPQCRNRDAIQHAHTGVAVVLRSMQVACGPLTMVFLNTRLDADRLCYDLRANHQPWAQGSQGT
jgi:hypothetical protein